MKKNFRFWHLIAFILAGFVVIFGLSLLVSLWPMPPTAMASTTPGAVVTPTYTPNPTLSVDPSSMDCVTAMHYYENGELDLARQAYESILKGLPSMLCAVTGLNQVNAAIAIQSSAAAPTPTIAPNSATTVPGLLAIGNFDEAYSQLTTSKQQEPTTALDQTLGIRTWVGWNFIKNFTNQLFLPALAFIVVAIVIVILGMKLSTSRKTCQMDIKKFTFGSFSIKDDDGFPESISQRMKTVLSLYYSGDENLSKKEIGDPPARFTQIVNKPVLQNDLPPTILAQVNSMWAFLLKLFPPTVLTVNGALEYHPTKGVGLSLSFDDNDANNIARQITLWEKNLFNDHTISPTPPSKEEYFKRCFDLADIAGAWVYWQILMHGSDAEMVKNLLGTDNFESYEWFVLSMIHRRKMAGRSASARAVEHDNLKGLLQKSLHKDPHNTLTLLNLGFWHYNLKDGLQKETIKLLHHAIMNGASESPTVIQANYFLGDTRFSEWLASFGKKEVELSTLSSAHRNSFFGNYFKAAFEGAQKTDQINLNTRFMFQIPYLIDLVAFDDKRVGNALTILSAMERYKSSLLDSTCFKENRVDLFYNLACFYSLVCNCHVFTHQAARLLNKRFYRLESGMESDKRTFLQFSLHNFKLALEANYPKVLHYCKKDAWLVNLRENLSDEFDDLFNEYYYMSNFTEEEPKKIPTKAKAKQKVKPK